MNFNYSIQKVSEIYEAMLADTTTENIALAIQNGTVDTYVNRRHSFSEQDIMMVVCFAKTNINFNKMLNKMFSTQKSLSEEAIVFLMQDIEAKDILCANYSSFEIKTKVFILTNSDVDLKIKLITSEPYLD